MKKFIRLISLILIITLFSNTLYSCVFIPSDETGDAGNKEDDKQLPAYGNKVGKRCLPADLELISGEGIVNIKNIVGKVVVINFWGTWCGPCTGELPHFNEVAEEYADSVVIITVHSYDGIEDAPDHINKYFYNSKMIFANDNEEDKYYKMLNPGLGAWPVTIVLDEDGVITYKVVGAIDKATLVSQIENAR